MNQSPEFSELEQAFFNDGYAIASDAIEKGNSEIGLIQALGQFYSELDSFNSMFLENAKKTGSPVQCEKGCAWCCHQAVFAQSYEIKYLKKWMFENLTASEIEDIRIGAKEKRTITNFLTMEERLLIKFPCPVLKNNACMAYEGRPVACRIYHSMNVDSCKYEYNNPLDETRYPEIFEYSIKLGRKLNEGFAAGLEKYGFNIEESALEDGLLM